MRYTLTILMWLAGLAVWAQNSAPIVQVAITDISCAGRKDGQFELTLLSGQLPVNFQWANLSAGTLGIGQFSLLNEPLELANLAAGLYQFNFTDANGADTTFQRTIVEPLPLEGELIFISDYGGYEVKCSLGNDGAALFDVKGGTPPLTYLWSNGDNGVRSDSLPAGPVGVEVTDARGCTLMADTLLEAPSLIIVDVDAEGELCFGQNTGRFEIDGVSGGVPPYEFYLNNNPPSSQIVWDNLPAGQYFLYIEDAIGCIHTEGIVLPSGTEFILKFGADTSMLSGDTLRISYYVDPPADTLIWEPAIGVSALPGNEVLLSPILSTNYQVTGINIDGCTAQDDIEVLVSRDRDTYVPNVLAPYAQEMENRLFTIYGGAGIRTVEYLQVFDRFGRLWFENRNFPVNDPTSGWDGRNASDEAPNGVYLWRAVLQYTDGREVRLQGDVTLVK